MLRTLHTLAGWLVATAALPASTRGARDGDGAWDICFVDEGMVCQTDIASISLHVLKAGLASPEKHCDFRPPNLAGLLRSVRVMIALPFPSVSC